MGKYTKIYYLLNKYIFRWLPDNFYHNLLGFIMHKRYGVKYHWMNLSEPKTFSEKIQWLKNKGDIELKSKLADKYSVRDYVKNTVGVQYLTNLLPLNNNGDLLIDNINSIDFKVLPKQFVLKLTKGSGFNIICKDKSLLEEMRLKQKLSEWLNIETYYFSRQKEYLGPNRIICEEMLKYNIKDYKFFCFDGVPKFLKVDLDRFDNHRANYYDLKWDLLDIQEMSYPPDKDTNIKPPSKFKEMIELARRLSMGFPFVRVDLYEHDGKIYFGELTFSPAGGYVPINPRKWEFIMGDMIDLTNINI